MGRNKRSYLPSYRSKFPLFINVSLRKKKFILAKSIITYGKYVKNRDAKKYINT